MVCGEGEGGKGGSESDALFGNPFSFLPSLVDLRKRELVGLFFFSFGPLRQMRLN